MSHEASGTNPCPTKQQLRPSSTVLIVDDELDWLTLATVWMERSGYKVVSTNDPTQVVTLAEMCRPDCIVIDYDLGSCNALELLAEIQRTKPLKSIPIIVLTSFRETKIKSLYSGADQFVIKTGSPEELLAALHACLRRKEMNRRSFAQGRSSDPHEKSQ